MSNLVDSYHVILAEMYNELRAYREKEFQTFLFAFPIIGSGFVPGIASRPLILLVSLFGIVVCLYIVKNIYRSMRIRKVIVDIQGKLGLNTDVLKPMKPEVWANKKLYQHFGTMIYLILIVAQVILLLVYQYQKLSW